MAPCLIWEDPEEEEEEDEEGIWARLEASRSFGEMAWNPKEQPMLWVNGGSHWNPTLHSWFKPPSETVLAVCGKATCTWEIPGATSHRSYLEAFTTPLPV